MDRLTERKFDGGLAYWSDEKAIGAMAAKLAEYEDAEEQGRLVMLPAAIGDKIKDRHDYGWEIQSVSLYPKKQAPYDMLLRLGNEGTDDYSSLYASEFNECTILPREADPPKTE